MVELRNTFYGEPDVDNWFQENFDKLGFEKILSVAEAYVAGLTTPRGDYAGLRNGKWLKIELEFHSSAFFLHPKEMRDTIDMVICYQRNVSRTPEHNIELDSKEVIELRWSDLVLKS